MISGSLTIKCVVDDGMLLVCFYYRCLDRTDFILSTIEAFMYRELSVSPQAAYKKPGLSHCVLVGNSNYHRDQGNNKRGEKIWC